MVKKPILKTAAPILSAIIHNDKLSSARDVAANLARKTTAPFNPITLTGTNLAAHSRFEELSKNYPNAIGFAAAYKGPLKNTLAGIDPQIARATMSSVILPLLEGLIQGKAEPDSIDYVLSQYAIAIEELSLLSLCHGPPEIKLLMLEALPQIGAAIAHETMPKLKALFTLVKETGGYTSKLLISRQHLLAESDWQKLIDNIKLAVKGNEDSINWLQTKIVGLYLSELINTLKLIQDEHFINSCEEKDGVFHICFDYSTNDSDIELASKYFKHLNPDLLLNLDLSNCDKITDAAFSHLKEINNISGLALAGTKRITNQGIAHLKELKHLSSLKLAGLILISEAGIARLKGLKNLSTLDLANLILIEDSTLELLKGLENLSSLNLKGCFKITDEGIGHLEGLVKLASLNLGACIEITDGGIAHLQKLTNLSSLILDDCFQITDEAIFHIINLAHLSKLSLAGCSKITDAGIAYMKSFSSTAQNLNLAGCSKITDEALAHLSNLAILSSLKLTGCSNITDTGIAHLQNLLNLSSLILKGCNITDRGLAFLQNLSRLSSLDLTRCNITDSGLAELKGLSRLTDLNLYGCSKITDKGIAHLQELTHLSNLNIHGCTEITEEGRQSLIKSIPGLKIW